jgi:hypothetical protein
MAACSELPAGVRLALTPQLIDSKVAASAASVRQPEAAGRNVHLGLSREISNDALGHILGRQ